MNKKSQIPQSGTSRKPAPLVRGRKSKIEKSAIPRSGTSPQLVPPRRDPQSKIQRVIVIAASAGGIDALTQVISNLPGDLPAVILIVQHLDPKRETRLPEYLGAHSLLKVRLAEEGAPLEEGVVYVAVPGQHLLIKNGRLKLELTEYVHYVRPAADLLFASAAETFGPQVIGIVLTGTGSDGAEGCRRIKAKGGITIAQDEETSSYHDMPKAAIKAQAIDYVLPLEEIAGKIVKLVRKETKK